MIIDFAKDKLKDLVNATGCPAGGLITCKALSPEGPSGILCMMTIIQLGGERLIEAEFMGKRDRHFPTPILIIRDQ